MTNPPVDVVDAPVTTPVKPKAPASPFDSPTKSRFDVASPFDALPRFDLAARFDAAGGAPPRSPFRRPASPFRSPFDNPRYSKRKRREVRRRSVILPQLGQRRREGKQWLWLPYEEICMIMEWIPGQFVYVPGMGEDFDSLAYGRAAQEYDCQGDADWCIEDRGGEHHHLMSAVGWPERPDWIPPDSSDLSCWGSEANYGMYEEWERIQELADSIRGRLWANPNVLLQQELIGGDAAARILKAGGFDLPNGLHSVGRLTETVRQFLPYDPGLRAAFGDYGTYFYGSSTDDAEISFLSEELEQLLEQYTNPPHEAHLWDPDELVYLAFDPADFLDWEMVRPDVARLSGEWLAIDAEYRSMADAEDHVRRKHPWVVGWREVYMKRCGWSRIDSPTLQAELERGRFGHALFNPDEDVMGI